MAQKKIPSHSGKGAPSRRPSSRSTPPRSGGRRPAARQKSQSLPLNWGLIVAIALVISVYLIVTLFNGRSYEGWKDSWDDLWGNFSSMTSGIPDDRKEGPAPVMAEGQTVQVTFLDVGQGDSMLIQGNGQAVLIDAGENDQGGRVADYLADYGVERLDLAIGTHPHSDHIGGLDVVLEEIPTREIWMPDLPDSLIPTTRTYTDLLDAMESTGTEGVTAVPGDQMEICGGILEILGPVKTYEDLNDMSLVAKFTFGDTSFLFTGDMEAEAEKDLIASGADLSADVLKMGHHGSSTSSSEAFVDAVNPDIFVIEVGEGNSYGHPHRETLALLREWQREVWRTDLNGNILMVSDGREITVTSER